jgi:hypothetical protein
MRNAIAILSVFIAGLGAGLLTIGILTRYTDAMCREPLETQNGFLIGGAVIAMLFLARYLWRSGSDRLSK